jgi:hypothetical protein
MQAMLLGFCTSSNPIALKLMINSSFLGCWLLNCHSHIDRATYGHISDAPLNQWLMVYVFLEHTTFNHWLKGASEIRPLAARSMLEWRFNNQRSKNKLSIVNFKAIELLEVQNPSSIACILESRLESTWGPRRNGDDEKYQYAKNFKEVEQSSQHTQHKRQ